jgi:hypothetical protein
VFGLQAYFAARRPVLAAESVVRDFNILRPDRDGSNDQLRQLGSTPSAPSFVNYAFLCGEPSLAILPGTQDDKKPVRVPQFFFAGKMEEQRAVVYAVPKKQFDVESESPDPGYKWKLAVEHDSENPRYVYLILHTGRDWEWLRQPPEK